MAGSDVSHASFRVAYPPTIRGGGEVSRRLFRGCGEHGGAMGINGDWLMLLSFGSRGEVKLIDFFGVCGGDKGS